MRRRGNLLLQVRLNARCMPCGVGGVRAAMSLLRVRCWCFPSFVEQGEAGRDFLFCVFLSLSLFVFLSFLNLPLPLALRLSSSCLFLSPLNKSRLKGARNRSGRAREKYGRGRRERRDRRGFLRLVFLVLGAPTATIAGDKHPPNRKSPGEIERRTV